MVLRVALCSSITPKPTGPIELKKITIPLIHNPYFYIAIYLSPNSKQVFNGSHVKICGSKRRPPCTSQLACHAVRGVCLLIVAAPATLPLHGAI